MIKRILKPAYLITLLIAFAGNSWALSLDEAKRSGLIGEQLNGYIGLVNNNDAAARGLVNDINNKRRAAYADKAQKAGVELKIIEIRIGERLQQRAGPGEYIQRSNGQWHKK